MNYQYNFIEYEQLMFELLFTILAIPALIFAFILLWVFITSILALVSGWFSLARKFAESRELNGEVHRRPSANMGWLFIFVSYSGCIHVILNEFGIGLRLVFSYKRVSPNLFIPWEDVRSMKVRSFWIFRSVRIKFKGFSRSITFYGTPSLRIYEVFKDACAD